MKQAATLFSSERADWNTPEELLAVVRRFASIGLDPCANAQSIVRAATEWTVEDDGLVRDWGGHGLVYINPEYGRAIVAWTIKFRVEGARGVEIVALLPARTDTIWWQRDVATADAICFWKGRLTFLGAPDPAPFPSAVAYWGPRAEDFRQLFRMYGWTIVNGGEQEADGEQEDDEIQVLRFDESDCACAIETSTINEGVFPMGQDVSGDIAGLISSSKVTGGSDNIRHGKYEFLIRRVFADLIENEFGKHRFAFVELTVLKASPNPQVEGNCDANGKLIDDGSHPNMVGSECALKVNFDGPGGKSAGGNIKAFILGLFNKRDGEIADKDVNATWKDLARQQDAWLVKGWVLNGSVVPPGTPNAVEDLVAHTIASGGVLVPVTQATPGAVFKRANPACGMVVGCSTYAKKKRTPNDKGTHTTRFNWSSIAPVGQGENAPELVAKRRAEIEAKVAAAASGDEDDDAVSTVVAPVAPNGQGQVAVPPPPPVVAPPPPVAWAPTLPWVAHPTAPGYYWSDPTKGGTNAVVPEAQLRGV